MPQLVPRKQKPEQIRPPVHDPLAPKSIATGDSHRVLQVEQVLPTTKSKRPPSPKDSDSEDEELSFASIVRDKPSPSKVALFLQECINEMVKDSDDDEDSHLESTEYETS